MNKHAFPFPLQNCSVNHMIIAPWDIKQCVKIKWRYGHKSTIETATALKCIGYVG